MKRVTFADNRRSDMGITDAFCEAYGRERIERDFFKRGISVKERVEAKLKARLKANITDNQMLIKVVTSYDFDEAKKIGFAIFDKLKLPRPVINLPDELIDELSNVDLKGMTIAQLLEDMNPDVLRKYQKIKVQEAESELLEEKMGASLTQGKVGEEALYHSIKRRVEREKKHFPGGFAQSSNGQDEEWLLNAVVATLEQSITPITKNGNAAGAVDRSSIEKLDTYSSKVKNTMLPLSILLSRVMAVKLAEMAREERCWTALTSDIHAKDRKRKVQKKWESDEIKLRYLIIRLQNTPDKNIDKLPNEVKDYLWGLENKVKLEEKRLYNNNQPLLTYLEGIAPIIKLTCLEIEAFKEVDGSRGASLGRPVERKVNGKKQRSQMKRSSHYNRIAGVKINQASGIDPDISDLLGEFFATSLLGDGVICPTAELVIDSKRNELLVNVPYLPKGETVQEKLDKGSYDKRVEKCAEILYALKDEIKHAYGLNFSSKAELINSIKRLAPEVKDSGLDVIEELLKAVRDSNELKAGDESGKKDKDKDPVRLYKKANKHRKFISPEIASPKDRIVNDKQTFFLENPIKKEIYKRMCEKMRVRDDDINLGNIYIKDDGTVAGIDLGKAYGEFIKEWRKDKDFKPRIRGENRGNTLDMLNRKRVSRHLPNKFHRHFSGVVTDMAFAEAMAEVAATNIDYTGLDLGIAKMQAIFADPNVPQALKDKIVPGLITLAKKMGKPFANEAQDPNELLEALKGKLIEYDQENKSEMASVANVLKIQALLEGYAKTGLPVGDVLKDQIMRIYASEANATGNHKYLRGGINSEIEWLRTDEDQEIFKGTLQEYIDHRAQQLRNNQNLNNLKIVATGEEVKKHEAAAAVMLSIKSLTDAKNELIKAQDVFAVRAVLGVGLEEVNDLEAQNIIDLVKEKPELAERIIYYADIAKDPKKLDDLVRLIETYPNDKGEFKKFYDLYITNKVYPLEKIRNAQLKVRADMALDEEIDKRLQKGDATYTSLEAGTKAQLRDLVKVNLRYDYGTGDHLVSSKVNQVLNDHFQESAKTTVLGMADSLTKSTLMTTFSEEPNKESAKNDLKDNQNQIEARTIAFLTGEAPPQKTELKLKAELLKNEKTYAQLYEILGELKDLKEQVYWHKYVNLDGTAHLIRDARARGATSHLDKNNLLGRVMIVLNTLRAAEEMSSNNAELQAIKVELMKNAYMGLEFDYQEFNNRIIRILEQNKTLGKAKDIQERLRITNEFLHLRDDQQRHVTTIATANKNGVGPVNVIETDTMVCGLSVKQRVMYAKLRDTKDLRELKIDKEFDWFFAMPEYAQKLTIDCIPAILAGKGVIPTQLRKHLPGMRNAHCRSVSIFADNKLTKVFETFRTGALAYLGKDKEHAVGITEENIQQFMELTGRTPVVNDLLSSTYVPHFAKRLDGPAPQKYMDKAVANLRGVGLERVSTPFNGLRILARKNYTGYQAVLDKVAAFVTNDDIKAFLQTGKNEAAARGAMAGLEEPLRSELENAVNAKANMMRRFISPTIGMGGNLSAQIAADMANVFFSLTNQGCALRGAVGDVEADKLALIIMCMSGKDRTQTVLAESARRALEVAGVENPEQVVVRYLGHAQFMAQFNGGTLGCYGVQKNSANHASPKLQVVKDLLGQKTASLNKMKFKLPQKVKKDLRAFLANVPVSKTSTELTEQEVNIAVALNSELEILKALFRQDVVANKIGGQAIDPAALEKLFKISSIEDAKAKLPYLEQFVERYVPTETKRTGKLQYKRMQAYEQIRIGVQNYGELLSYYIDVVREGGELKGNEVALAKALQEELGEIIWNYNKKFIEKGGSLDELIVDGMSARKKLLGEEKEFEKIVVVGGIKESELKSPYLKKRVRAIWDEINKPIKDELDAIVNSWPSILGNRDLAEVKSPQVTLEERMQAALKYLLELREEAKNIPQKADLEKIVALGIKNGILPEMNSPGKITTNTNAPRPSLTPFQKANIAIALVRGKAGLLPPAAVAAALANVAARGASAPTSLTEEERNNKFQEIVGGLGALLSKLDGERNEVKILKIICSTLPNSVKGILRAQDKLNQALSASEDSFTGKLRDLLYGKDEGGQRLKGVFELVLELGTYMDLVPENAFKDEKAKEEFLKKCAGFSLKDVYAEIMAFEASPKPLDYSKLDIKLPKIPASLATSATTGGKGGSPVTAPATTTLTTKGAAVGGASASSGTQSPSTPSAQGNGGVDPL
ncbi:MAG: hypothetical protein ACHP6I_01330 [Rickettsiales bacterium]